MDLSRQIVSDITIYNKYARYLPNLKRKETWDEIVTRNKNYFVSKYPQIKDELDWAYQFVYDREVLPSMRGLQFAGKALQMCPNRIYNCAYAPVDDLKIFSEFAFLLLGGSGVGFSVQRHHIRKLPVINKPNNKKRTRYLIGDSIEGWSDAINLLIQTYFSGGHSINFDYSDIRPKGSLLVTSGGKAPGPAPLRECMVKILNILENKDNGDQLTSLEIHDIICHIADAVYAGGIRRAALISLFSYDDEEMISCKNPIKITHNPQRYRANNSVVFLRHKIKKEDFFNFWKRVEQFNNGEPGIFFTNDKDWGTNPCGEIALRPFSFCNLTELNGAIIKTQEELNNCSIAASIIATAQAGETDFHYLRPIWKENTEKDSLIGIGITGIATGRILNLDLKESAKLVIDTNIKVARQIGINPSSRCTTIKPSGTTSLVLGTSSGIHAWHSEYYIRRVRLNKTEGIYSYLKEKIPQLLEDLIEDPKNGAVACLPQKAPENSIYRTEDTFDFLERVKKVKSEWINSGHVSGQNTNNVSATISIKPNQWKKVGEWMWKNKNNFNGLSVFPIWDKPFPQPPFEEITKEKYEEMYQYLQQIDLSEVVELEDTTNFTKELACAGGSCEIL